MLTVRIGKRDGVMTEKEMITAGSVGFKVRVVFSPVWKELTKWASFRAGDVKRPVKITSTASVVEIEVPWEVLVTTGLYLEMGIKGISGDGELVIPTIYINLGMIQEGADSEGTEGTDPTPTQIEALWLAVETLQKGGGIQGVGIDTIEIEEV